MNNNIIETLTRIEAKLDEVIAALHAYDDDNIYSGYDEPNVVLLKAAGLYNEAEANKRMDIIGQNGNEGSHYVTNKEADEDAATFNDYGMRVGKDKDSNNTQDKRTGGDKKRNKRKYYKPKQTK
jgi:hypothetical protein